MQLSEMIDLERYPLTDRDYVAKCQARFLSDGVVVLPGFLTESAIQQVHDEAIEGMPQAYYCKTESNVYLLPRDPERPPEHARNRLVSSSKGCICDDTIPADSPLRVAYQSEIFQGFVKGVTGQASLYPYADTLSSINIHYAHQGQELGWHFDNSAFAITLLIQAAQDGGEFQYVTRKMGVAKPVIGIRCVGPRGGYRRRELWRVQLELFVLQFADGELIDE